MATRIHRQGADQPGRRDASWDEDQPTRPRVSTRELAAHTEREEPDPEERVATSPRIDPEDFMVDSVSSAFGADDSVVAFLREGGLDTDSWDEVGEDSGIFPAESFLEAAMRDASRSRALKRARIPGADAGSTAVGAPESED